MVNVSCGSTTEVSDGHENVRSWVTSGSRIWAAGGLLVANSGSPAEVTGRSAPGGKADIIWRKADIIHKPPDKHPDRGRAVDDRPRGPRRATHRAGAPNRRPWDDPHHDPVDGDLGALWARITPPPPAPRPAYKPVVAGVTAAMTHGTTRTTTDNSPHLRPRNPF